MKKLLYLFSLLAIVSMVIFFGCKKDEEAVPPTLSLLFVDSYGVTPDGDIMDPEETMTITWTATKGDKNLKSFSVTKDNANLADFNGGLPKDLSGSDYSDSLITTADLSGSAAYKFVVTDKNDNTSEVSFTITVVTFGTDNTGQLHHIQGASGCTGAYNLVTGASVAGTGAEGDKDIKNTDAAGAAFTGSWETGTGNNTMYVKAAGTFTYAGAKVKSSIAAYDAGTKIATIAPSANDVYIAKLRGGTTYAVIEITSIDPNDVTCNATTLNKGKMSFQFKKN